MSNITNESLKRIERLNNENRKSLKRASKILYDKKRTPKRRLQEFIDRRYSLLQFDPMRIVLENIVEEFCKKTVERNQKLFLSNCSLLSIDVSDSGRNTMKNIYKRIVKDVSELIREFEDPKDLEKGEESSEYDEADPFEMYTRASACFHFHAGRTMKDFSLCYHMAEFNKLLGYSLCETMLGAVSEAVSMEEEEYEQQLKDLIEIVERNL